MSEPLKGLSSAEVSERIASGQVNRAPRHTWRDAAEIVRRNTLTAFNALVVPAAVALFLLADYRGAWAVSAMAVANTAIGLFHEFRAKRHLDRLSLLGEVRVRVRRDGNESTIPSGEVVSGDLVLLAAGESAVADGTVVAASFLEMDEALLTGESDPVARGVGEAVKSGSVCVAGEGAYRAEQVGPEAFAQKTAAAARAYRYAPGPTQHTLDRLVKGLTALAVALCLGYVGLFFLRGFPATDLVQMLGATITSMVPQGLVLLTTLVFVLSAARLSRSGAVVQRLSAVEGLAAVDVLCTDKTGTLTTGRLALDHLECFAVPEADVRRWLGAFAAASVDRRNKSIEALRESLPFETSGMEVVDQLPFQSQNRFSAIQIRIEGESRLGVLGSAEALRPRLSESDWTAVESAWHKQLSSGLRLLLFADGTTTDPLAGRLPEVPLRPLALIALRDELRPEAAAVVAALAAQGIRFKVVSGDHPETVRATVASLGDALEGGTLMTGDEWSASADRAALAESCNVFGRVSPEQKLALVDELRKAGRNVGMIGDGVNDILPIKRADFGVAMGAGSPATKAVAGLVLESNDFSALPAVLAEGRLVVGNVRRAAKLFLLKNVYTIALIAVAVGLCGLPFPYLPQQVTLLNALTIGGPAMLILSGRTATPGAVKANFFADVGRFLAVAGLATSAVGLAVYLVSSFILHHEIERTRTLLLAALVLAGVGNAVALTRGDWRLLLWGAFAAIALAGAVHIDPVNYFFALVPLDGASWLAVTVAAIAAVLPAALFSEGGVRAGGNRR